MAGSWSALFYEDQSTWASTVADVCTAVINYGVELPWCVCAKSWTIISLVKAYLLWAAASASAFLRLDEWWSVEYTMVVIFILPILPVFAKKAKGNWYHFLSQLLTASTLLLWFGTFLRLAHGLQNGVVFGGKFHNPTLALAALACHGVRLTLMGFEKEVFGYGAVDESAKDAKINRVFKHFYNFLGLEMVMIACLAVFGFPAVEADVDPKPWLIAFPFLGLLKQVQDYEYGSTASVAKESNGDLPTKEAAKAKTDSTKEKVDAKKAKEDKTEGEEVKKGEASLVNGLSNLVGTLVGLFTNAVSSVISLVNGLYARVAALPWEHITDVIVKLGIVSTSMAYIHELLGELHIMMAVPLLLFVAPELLDRYVGPNGKFVCGKEETNVMKELALTAGVGLQYYVIKNNTVLF